MYRPLSERLRDPTSAMTKVACKKIMSEAAAEIDELNAVLKLSPRAPVPMRLRCPACNSLHVDEGEFATKPHHTHACQNCGEVWRPAVIATVGVQFLPGFKNEG